MDSKSITLGRKSVPAIETDLLVIGSGFAGLWAALTAREQGVDRVTLVDKASIGKSSQSRVCAGATIYCLPEDDVEVWLRDMAEAQGFLSRQDMVADMLTTSYSRLQRLEGWGVEYQRDPGKGGYLRLPSRGFRQVKMMVLPRRGKNVGGAAVVAALMRQIRRLGIESHPRILVTDLLRSNGRVAGALGLDRSSGELRACPTWSFSAPTPARRGSASREPAWRCAGAGRS